MTVVAVHLGLRGELLSVAGDTASVQAGAVTVRVPLSALRRATELAAPAPAARRVVRDGNGDAPAPRSTAQELMLIGRTTDEARDLVEKYLDDAFMAGLANVRLIHGKGTGALRKAVRSVLSDHPLVESFRDGSPAEGGNGATVAEMKVS
jgi:DNA mismatch repair protein MutS2